MSQTGGVEATKGQTKKKDTPNGTSTSKKPKDIKDEKKEVRDAKNKMKFHSTKMDLNLKILREEMVRRSFFFVQNLISLFCDTLLSVHPLQNCKLRLPPLSTPLPSGFEECHYIQTRKNVSTHP